MPAKDPDVRRATWRRWYQNNKHKQIKRVRGQSRRNRTEIQQYKSTTPCTDCKQCYPHYVMDFDHVTGEKLANVADLTRTNHSRKQVWEEIAKCELVCANCHRARTHFRRQERKKHTHKDDNGSTPA